MRVDAALADEPELVQPMQQRRADLGPLAYQHQRFRIPQSFGQRIDILDMIVPDFDFVTCHLFEAVESAKRIVIVVQNGDLQLGGSLMLFGSARAIFFYQRRPRMPFVRR